MEGEKGEEEEMEEEKKGQRKRKERGKGKNPRYILPHKQVSRNNHRLQGITRDGRSSGVNIAKEQDDRQARSGNGHLQESDDHKHCKYLEARFMLQKINM